MTPKPHAHLEEPFWRPFPSPSPSLSPILRLGTDRPICLLTAMTDHFSACDPPLKREAKSVGERNRTEQRRGGGGGDGRKGEREQEHIRARMDSQTPHGA